MEDSSFGMNRENSARSGEIGIQILYNRVLTNESSNRHPIINEVDRSQPKGRSLVSVPRIDSRATIGSRIESIVFDYYY